MNNTCLFQWTCSRYILLIALLLHTFSLFSQQFNFKTYSIEEGLPQSTVYDLLQDSKGYLWIGTNGGGVCKFDGIHFIVFNRKSGLADNVVRELYEDDSGNIWVGTDEGISVFDGYKVKNITKKDGLSGDAVLCIDQDKQGNIWAGTNNGGLNRIAWNKDTITSIDAVTKDDGLKSSFVFDLLLDPQQRIWLCMVGGIHIISFRQDELNIDYLLEGLHIPSSMIMNVEQDIHGDLWFGTYDAGAFKIKYSDNIDDLRTELYDGPQQLNDYTVWDILCDNEGNTWFCTDIGGVNRLRDGVFDYFYVENGLPANQILKGLQDKEGNIWFGTDGNGICRYLGDHLVHYDQLGGLSGNQITDIEVDEDNVFWISSLGNGVMRVKVTENRVISGYQFIKGLPSRFIRDIDMDRNNHLWMASAENGIINYKGQDIINLTSENGLVYDEINCICADSKDRIWCGTSGGISIFNRNGFFNIEKNSSYNLVSDEIQTIIEDLSGNIWVGTLDGLVRFHDSHMTDYNEKDGLSNKKIHSLAEDHQGNIWIGTFGGGLYKFTREKDSLPVEFIVDDQQLSSNNIYSLVFENQESLIVGTDRGFDKVIIDDAFQIVSVRNYGRDEGFQGMENLQNAICNDKNGNIWFGTINGLTCYTPHLEKIIDITPDIYITGIELFYEEVNWNYFSDSTRKWFNIPFYAEFPHYENHITFNFQGISLSNPGKVKYRYMLKGQDQEWSPPRQENLATYPGLNPGRYVFKVTARNAQGTWSEEPASFAFIIKPPFWNTIWFYILIIALCVILILSYIKFRERNLIKKNKELEDKVEERTLEIVQQKSEIEKKNENLNRAYDEIKLQKDIIEEKQLNITSSIKYAKHIQESVLQSKDILRCFFDDSFVLYKPKDIVSGDFYWVKDKGNEILVVAADCTGHGVPGAFMSLLGISLLNRITETQDITDPAELMDKMRRNIINALNQNEDHATFRDGMDATIIKVNRDTGKLIFSGANNPLYHIRNSELYEIKGDKMPVSLHSVMDKFTNHELQLNKGDAIYMFSDGYADQFGGPNGKKLKYKQFKELLLQWSSEPMEIQNRKLEAYFSRWKGAFEQIDDIVILGIRF